MSFIYKYHFRYLVLDKCILVLNLKNIRMLLIIEQIFSTWKIPNEGKSAAIFCRQVAAWGTDMFRNFCSVKSHKIADNSATIEAAEKISIDLESVEF
jgi:hypothetical protein